MAVIHKRDKFKHPSGVCGAGWRDGLDEKGKPVTTVRADDRVDCPACLRSLFPGQRVGRHGRVTIVFDPANLLGNARFIVRQDDGTELELEAPLMHVLGAAVKTVQNMGEVAAGAASALLDVTT